MRTSRIVIPTHILRIGAPSVPLMRSLLLEAILADTSRIEIGSRRYGSRLRISAYCYGGSGESTLVVRNRHLPRMRLEHVEHRSLLGSRTRRGRRAAPPGSDPDGQGRHRPKAVLLAERWPFLHRRDGTARA